MPTDGKIAARAVIAANPSVALLTIPARPRCRPLVPPPIGSSSLIARILISSESVEGPEAYHISSSPRVLHCTPARPELAILNRK